jgi:hypothetical protein
MVDSLQDVFPNPAKPEPNKKEMHPDSLLIRDQGRKDFAKKNSENPLRFLRLCVKVLPKNVKTLLLTD